MKKRIKTYDSCGGRGCNVIILTRDSLVRTFHFQVLRKRYDFSKILPVACISLDQKLATQRPVEKKIF